MVDTINPNTNQPDSWGDDQAQAPVSTPENRFFGGFNQPDGTKINLANNTQPTSAIPTATPTPPVQEVSHVAAMSEQPPSFVPPVQTTPQPVQDVSAPVQPAEVKPTTYVNTSDRINWRGILVIVALGLVATVVVGAGLFFGLGSLNNSKLKSQQDQLSSIQKELSSLQVTPNPLELPATVTTTTPSDSTTVTTPVTPTETPVTTPATLPSGNTDGSKTAAG
jgi:hypothetical protein